MHSTVTQPITCLPWCGSPGHHPDNYCVQADVTVRDLYGIGTNIAAFADVSRGEVGVYAGYQIFRPVDARAFAAALLNAADTAEQALDAINEATDHRVPSGSAR